MEDNRGYQINFSSMLSDAMYDRDRREKKARTMLVIIRDFIGSDLRRFKLLDVGCSTGFIGNYLADYFGQVIGIDIDELAINFAQANCKKKNLNFLKADSMSMKFSENIFDIAICAHIYEHVPDAERLMAEIYRVLKPRGVCYFAAGNRLNVKEPHYNLPFLSILPRSLAHVYIRTSGKNKFYYEKHLSYWGLKRLVQKFERIDYTQKIIESPEEFHAEYLISPDTKKGKLARLIVKYAYWLSPTYIWLLRKPQQSMPEMKCP